MNIFQKRKTLIADVFPKIRIPKNVLNKIFNRSHFKGHFNERYVEREEALLKSGRHHLWHSYWCLWRKLCVKKPLLLICKVWKLFVHALTSPDKCSLRNKDNSTKPIQMILSQKQENLSQFVFIFLKSTLNFKHFSKKEDPHGWCISEITDSEKRA